MKKTFEKLNVGDQFRFTTQTKVGCGMFNGIGLKTAKSIYSMGGISREIGDIKTQVERRLGKTDQREDTRANNLAELKRQRLLLMRLGKS